MIFKDKKYGNGFGATHFRCNSRDCRKDKSDAGHRPRVDRLDVADFGLMARSQAMKICPHFDLFGLGPGRRFGCVGDLARPERQRLAITRLDCYQWLSFHSLSEFYLAAGNSVDCVRRRYRPF